MYVHPDIDIVHEIAPACDFEFLTAFVAIHAPKYDLTFAERLRLLLPFAGESSDVRFRLKAVNHHFGEMELGRFGKNISRRGSDKAIQIRLLDNIIVIEDVTLKADMGKLLDNM
jgi:hypothetical protein